MSAELIFSLIDSNLPIYLPSALIKVIIGYYCEDDFSNLSNFNEYRRHYYRILERPYTTSSIVIDSETDTYFIYLMYLCKIKFEDCKSFDSTAKKFRKRFYRCFILGCRNKNIISYGLLKDTWKPICFCDQHWCVKFEYLGVKWMCTAKISTDCCYEVILHYKKDSKGIGEWLIKILV